MESKDEGANKVATVPGWKLADYNRITHILKTRKHKKVSQNPTTLPSIYISPHNNLFLCCREGGVPDLCCCCFVF